MRHIADFLGIVDGLGLLGDPLAEFDFMPADPEACKTCQWHRSNLELGAEDGYCYMFAELPETKCMQHKLVE